LLGKRGKENDVTSPTPRQAAASAGDRNVSVISKEMRIVGDCETDGPLRIEGKITGDVRARGLELAQSGTVSGDLSTLEGAKDDQVFLIDGNVDGTVRARQVEVRKTGVVLGGIDADQATIHGRVKGGILARVRLSMGETAVVEGDVRARRLALQEGGQVNGTILMGERAASEGSSSEEDALEEKGAAVEKGAVSEAEAATWEAGKGDGSKGDESTGDESKDSVTADSSSSVDTARGGVGAKGASRSGAKSGAKAE